MPNEMEDFDQYENDQEGEEEEEADSLDCFRAPSLEELKMATGERNRENQQTQDLLNVLQEKAISRLVESCIKNISLGRGIPDAFEDSLNNAIKKFGAGGEDAFISALNRQLSDAGSNFRIRPGAVPEEHANDPNYRVYDLTDARNGDIIDTASFALGRHDAPAQAQPEAQVRVDIDNVYDTAIPDLVAPCLDRMRDGNGIPDAFETGLNAAIAKYGTAGEDVYIQLMNQKLAAAGSNFRIRPGAIPEEHAKNPDYRVYTLTNVQTGEFADTASFSLDQSRRINRR